MSRGLRVCVHDAERDMCFPWMIKAATDKLSFIFLSDEAATGIEVTIDVSE